MPNYQKYCLHQAIKYTSWSVVNFSEISNIENAIERWNNFLITASPEVLSTIKFTTELSKQLQDARLELADPISEPLLLRENWMLLAEMRPCDLNFDDFAGIEIDRDYDWKSHLKNYTLNQQAEMRRWVEIQKEIFSNVSNDNLNFVKPSELNQIQRFAYNLIEFYNNLNRQLLIIINGTAGKDF